MPASDAALAALARSYQDRQIRLAQGTAQTAGALWDRLGPVSDEALAGWLDTIVPVVQGAQSASMHLTAGYLGAYVTAATGEPETSLAFDTVEAIAALRGRTEATTVYARPTITARRLISEGRSTLDALRVARARLTSTAETDVMLAARDAGHRTMIRIQRVVGYRRVPNAKACEFCLLASTQRYTHNDLMPLHSHCRCTIAPIIGTRDPGHVLAPDLTDRLRKLDPGIGLTGAAKQRARDLAAWDRLPQAEVRARAQQLYSDTVAVHEHGELGPVLTSSTDHFTGPAGIPTSVN